LRHKSIEVLGRAEKRSSSSRARRERRWLRLPYGGDQPGDPLQRDDKIRRVDVVREAAAT
jgi:hypothetical protein